MATLSRRNFGLGVASGAIVALSRSSKAYSTEHALNWDDPAERLDTMIRMMGHTEGGVAIRWTHGVLSAVIDQDTTQLFGISQQVCTRHRRNEDGSYEAAYLEFVYFSDLKTGAVMETWRNPYTDRTVTVPAQILGPTKVKIPLDLTVINEPFPMEGLVNTHWLEPLPILGGDVMFNERIDSYVPPMTDGGAPLVFHEVFSFRASVDAVANTSAPHIPTTVDKVNVISWRPWMDMAEVEGVTMSRGAGRVISDYNELPADLAENNRIHFPDVVDELADYLEV